MELPDLGKHCSVSTCQQLDFLPVKCDACQKIFCKDHYAYTQHDCPFSHRQDRQVPVCPLCNKPVAITTGQTPDFVVGLHIDNDCKSDKAESRRKVYGSKCSVKGCKEKEMVKVVCGRCHKNFCLKHRLEMDHSCTGFQDSESSISSAGAAAIFRLQESVQPPPKTADKQPTATSDGSRRRVNNIAQIPQVDRNSAGYRDRRAANAAAATARSLRPTAAQVHSMQQPGLSEEEAIRRAIEQSLGAQSSSQSAIPGASTDRRLQEEADEALARALEESEREAAARQRSATTTAANDSKTSSCALS